MAAFRGVENFMGKIAAENKCVPPGFLDRETQTTVVDVETDIEPSFADLPAQIIAGLFSAAPLIANSKRPNTSAPSSTQPGEPKTPEKVRTPSIVTV